MKNFSNETKNKRRNAIFKVILKRYSFIVWLPVLLIICNFIGATFLTLTVAPESYIGYSIFFIYFLNVLVGFAIGIAILITIIFIVATIDDFIKYLKRGTIIEDFINNIKLVAEMFIFCILIPKKIFLRIKDEKRRFNNALQKELEKE
ncbi:MAG: hypothetical protein HFJ42_06175 [Clostridia bacterium]|nr:hypothetical protein [Clostridia bacterium]